MAFVLNIPMRAYEEKLFRRWRGKSAAKCKRPLCLVLSIVSVSVVIAIVVGTVVPQVVTTASEIGRKIPAFTDKVLENLDRLMKDYPEVTAKIDELELTEIKWDSVLDSIIDFLKNGAGDVLNSTVSVASGIISGIVNGGDILYLCHLCPVPERKAGGSGAADSDGLSAKGRGGQDR